MPGSTLWSYNSGDWDGYLPTTAFINILRELTYAVNERWWMLEGYKTTGPGSSDDSHRITSPHLWRPMAVFRWDADVSSATTDYLFYPASSDLWYIQRGVRTDQVPNLRPVQAFDSSKTETIGAICWRLQQMIDTILSTFRPISQGSSAGSGNPANYPAFWKRTSGTTDYQSSTDYYNGSSQVLAAGSYGSTWITPAGLTSTGNREWDDYGDIVRQIQEALDNMRYLWIGITGVSNYRLRTVSATGPSANGAWYDAVNQASTLYNFNATGYGVNHTGTTGWGNSFKGATSDASGPNAHNMPDNGHRGAHHAFGIANNPVGTFIVDDFTLNWNFTGMIGTPLISRFVFVTRGAHLGATAFTGTVYIDSASSSGDWVQDIKSSTFQVHTLTASSWPVTSTQTLADATTSVISKFELQSPTTGQWASGSSWPPLQAFVMPRTYYEGLVNNANSSSAHSYGATQYRALGISEAVGGKASTSASESLLATTNAYDWCHMIVDIRTGLTYG